MKFFDRYKKPIVIAEIAQAHDGSLGTAHALVSAAAAAGADVVKFQTHIAEAESHPSEPWRVKFSPQDSSRYEYWKRMEFSPSQWRGLYQHSQDLGLKFCSSPFSHQAVELLRETGIDYWKVASGEIENYPLLELISDDGKPSIISSGLSVMDDIERAARIFTSKQINVAVLQCTSLYPCPAEKLGLNQLDELRQRLNVATGLSDHSGTIFAGLAAVALGASVIEVHITFSRESFGPDVPASITINDLRTLCDGVDFIHRAISNPLDKESMESSLGAVKRLFSRSVVARNFIAAGEVITEDKLVLKKPGTGLPPTSMQYLLGKRALRPIAANEFLDLSAVTGDEGE